MGFVFQFQSLLDWKRNLEELSQMKLADKGRRLRVQEEEIRELTERRVREATDIEKKITMGIHAGELLLYKQSDEAHYQGLVRMEGKRQEILKEMEEERDRLVGLMRQRKTIEKLRERSLKAFTHRMDKLEQKTLDDLFLARYNRKT